VSTIEGALIAGDLSTERLVIEITESVSRLNVAETVKVIERLDRLGIGIALGDFENGESSLSYLSLLHPRFIKVDQSSIHSGNDDDENELLLEAIVSLGQQLDMTVLAERLETQGQSAHLRHLGCELGQGFLYSPAVPAFEAAAMVGRVMGD
jgi:EAL domain-containing protein (putative c-di-GMP-specific phosphodiesterase class I)